MKSCKLRVIVLIGCLIIVAGCATHYSVSVSSLKGSTESVGSTVFIYPGDPSLNPSDLLYQEFAGQVAFALESQGFDVVTEPTDADQVVFLTYGISDPQTQSIAIPQYGRTGVRSSSTTGTLNVNPGQVQGHSTTTYQYDYGITGYTQTQRTVYTRMVLLYAYDWDHFLQTEQMTALWQTQMVSTGSSGDIRRVFPYLIAAAEPHLGRNTSQAVSVTIRENDDRVRPYLGE